MSGPQKLTIGQRDLFALLAVVHQATYATRHIVKAAQIASNPMSSQTEKADALRYIDRSLHVADDLDRIAMEIVLYGPDA